ncbi:MAG: DUF1330 domain-containing protein [Chloroflexota bacterium]|nr:DUF1330 domain-containing protein [Chloroflexota bacterium]
MPAYVIVEIEVTDPEGYAAYRELAPPIVAAHGGKYIVRGGELTVLEGDWQPQRLVVLEFPSVEQAKAWWSSAEYAGPKQMRQQTTRSRMIVVEGL